MQAIAAEAGGRELLRRVGFPHPPYAWRLLRSSFFAWLALRVALASSLFMVHGHPWAPPDARAALLFVVVPTLLLLLDMRVLREGTFYRDCGSAPSWAVLIGLVGAGVPEIVADAVLRATCGCA